MNTATQFHYTLQNYVHAMEDVTTQHDSYNKDLKEKYRHWKYYRFPALLNFRAIERIEEDLEEFREVYSSLRSRMDAVEDIERDLKYQLGVMKDVMSEKSIDEA